jgi:hypothetical protein
VDAKRNLELEKVPQRVFPDVPDVPDVVPRVFQVRDVNMELKKMVNAKRNLELKSPKAIFKTS